MTTTDQTQQRTGRGTRAGKPAPVRPRRPPMRGWLGRGRGQSFYLQTPAEWRGTTMQVCGLWPFAVGAGTPMVGVPFGRHIHTGATLCCDPISWYQRANLIGNPSVFFLGRPGLGKTSAVMRMAVGLSGYGVIPLVLGSVRSGPGPLRKQPPGHTGHVRKGSR